jgi:hypothetical protein
MTDLQTEIDQLEDQRLDYVMARSKVNSDSAGYRDAGISKSWFYSWPVEEREKLNKLAQRVKRETAVMAMMKLANAVDRAAEIKIAGLESRNENIKQSASTEILDRVVGRPTQKTELTGKDGGPLTWQEFINQGGEE